MMPDDFAALILTHKRPDRQLTLSTLRRSGYTGRIYLVVDDGDPTLPEYISKYGDMVVVFPKAEAHALTDDADNSGSMKGVVYARNYCWKIAKDLGLRCFIELDDDYGTHFTVRFNSELVYGHYPIKSRLDDVFSVMLSWLESSGATSVAFSQGGDHIGGGGSSDNKNGPTAKRKAMNGFLCLTDRPFMFYGRINEDTTAYVTLGKTGALFFTPYQVQLNQTETQAAAGGLTEIYLDAGTYYKSFLSVMWEPSCVKIAMMGSPASGNQARYRIHHRVDWNHAVPCIIPERFKKTSGEPDV
jgi:hypothetical protein